MTYIGLKKIKKGDITIEKNSDCTWDCTDSPKDIFMKKSSNFEILKLKKNYKISKLSKTHKIITNEYHSATIERIVLLKLRNINRLAKEYPATFRSLVAQHFLVDDE